MACTCVKRHLELTYKSETKLKPGGFTHYNQLIQYCYTVFPELRCHSIKLYLDSVVINPQQYNSLFTRRKLLEITIEKSLPIHNTPFAIFKLRLDEGDLIGTGFLFTYTLGFVCTEFCNQKMLPNLRILFEDGSEFKIKEGSLPVDLENNISLIEINENFTGLKPVTMETEKNVSYNGAYVYYYMKTHPELEKKPIAIMNFSPETYTIEIEEGSLGAPILSSDNKLLGIVNTLNTTIPIQEVLINMPESITIPSSFEFSKERAYVDFYPTPCFINHKNNTAGYYSADEAVNKTFNIVEMLKGSTATCTLYGIAIIGINTEMHSKALLYNGHNIEDLPNPLKKHLHHCSVFHNEHLYVIGGSSSVVEFFNFRENLWNSVQGLDKRRSFASAVASGKYVYVLGGKRNEKYLKSVLRLKGEKWKKLGICLPVNLANCGIIQGKSDFLVFGGCGREGVENDKSWRISLRNQTVDEEVFKVKGEFGRFSSLVMGGEALVYSNDCEMVKYDFEDNEICRVILDDESLFID